MPALPKSSFLRALVAFAAACAFSTVAAAAPPPAPDADARLTSTARLLAGAETDYAMHERIAALESWQAHRTALAPKWERLQRERLSVIETWRNQVLGSDISTCRTMLYPFSGPDFLNAYLLFPRCDTYVLFGLEAPGTVPQLESLSADEAGLFLKDMRVALTDFLERNYFITSRMAKQLHTPRLKGVLPLMLASMGLVDVRILSVEPFDLGPGSEAARRAGRRAQGVKITFSHAQVAKPQTLYYLSLDATDRALAANPEFLPFLAQFGSSVTFLKSASYLLQATSSPARARCCSTRPTCWSRTTPASRTATCAIAVSRCASSAATRGRSATSTTATSTTLPPPIAPAARWRNCHSRSAITGRTAAPA